MKSMIVSLVACVFACGAIGYLQWLFPRSRSLDTQPIQAITHGVKWRDGLLAFIAGACIAGFIFVINLSGYLSPHRRPLVPEISHGYSYFFTAKYGGVYGTYFEYLAVTYGVWATWGGLALMGAFVGVLKIRINEKSSTFPLLFFVGSAISMVFYYASWRAFLPIGTTISDN